MLILPIHYCYFNLGSLRYLNINYSSFLHIFVSKFSNYTSCFMKKFLEILDAFAKNIISLQNKTNFNLDNNLNISKAEEDFFEFSTTLLKLRYLSTFYFLNGNYIQAREEFSKLFLLEYENQFSQPTIRLYSTFVGSIIYKMNQTEQEYQKIKARIDEFIKRFEITLEQSQNEEISFLKSEKENSHRREKNSLYKIGSSNSSTPQRYFYNFKNSIGIWKILTKY